MECYTPSQPRSHLFRAAQDPVVACCSYAACTLWLLGYPDQALVYAHDALVLATDLAHPYSYAFALVFASMLRQFRREEEEVYEHVEAAATLSTEQGYSLWMTSSTIQRGWAFTVRGHREEGLVEIRRGLLDYRATGAELFVPYWLSLLAEGHISLKQVEPALGALNDGVEVMAHTGEHWWKAEVYRLRGDIFLHQATTDTAQAEACFHQALEVSHQQHAKSLELRAATGLARLWQSQGKRHEAHDLLAPV